MVLKDLSPNVAKFKANLKETASPVTWLVFAAAKNEKPPHASVRGLNLAFQLIKHVLLFCPTIAAPAAFFGELGSIVCIRTIRIKLVVAGITCSQHYIAFGKQ